MVIIKKNIFIEGVFPIDDEKMRSLQESGLRVLRKGKKAIAHLRQIQESDNEFYLPECLSPEELVIVADEFGGARTRGGNAVIVCKIDGTMLWPFRTYRPYWEARRDSPEQATFCAPTLARVESRNRSGRIRIVEYQISVNGRKAALEQKLVWEGNVAPLQRVCEICGELIDNTTVKHRLPSGTPCAATVKVTNAIIPQEIQHYRQAILAAATKASCYHCQHVHYGSIS